MPEHPTRDAFRVLAWSEADAVAQVSQRTGIDPAHLRVTGVETAFRLPWQQKRQVFHLIIEEPAPSRLQAS